jgi:hypothetical protein
MEKFALSPALEGKYKLDANQKSPIINIVGMGEIDLRTMTPYQVERMEASDTIFACLKALKK